MKSNYVKKSQICFNLILHRILHTKSHPNFINLMPWSIKPISWQGIWQAFAKEFYSVAKEVLRHRRTELTETKCKYPRCLSPLIILGKLGKTFVIVFGNVYNCKKNMRGFTLDSHCGSIWWIINENSKLLFYYIVWYHGKVLTLAPLPDTLCLVPRSHYCMRPMRDREGPGRCRLRTRQDITYVSFVFKLSVLFYSFIPTS